ncbi:MAG: BON domain-containing protein [Bryobacteraceae bacterium]|nr:BON domain-containing protein [Bryobacteraceae bacterium]
MTATQTGGAMKAFGKLVVLLAALSPLWAQTPRTNDISRLERQIHRELVTLPQYGVFDNIQFRVDGSKVTLLGEVNEPTLRTSAERVVSNIEGVQKVDNRLEVLPVSGQDDDIRRAVYRAVYSHPSLQRYQLRPVPPIHIIVKNGNVVLEGVVANEGDKNIANLQANGVPGVFGVKNNLRVEND